ncbi:MAG TPA: hypothetical protein VMC79_07075 [Rectinemataceae bacterium]|nr:hypothetical protein [Rectinemataceae bacterium]
MDERAEQFWQAFEAETGEKVESRAMGAWLERGGDEHGLWGLVVLTDRSFRFKHMPSENWLSSLFRMGKREAPSTKAVNIVASRDALVALDEPRRGFFARMFGPAFHQFRLSWRDGEGERSETFQVDPTADILPRLRTVVRGRRGPGEGQASGG